MGLGIEMREMAVEISIWFGVIADRDGDGQ